MAMTVDIEQIEARLNAATLGACQHTGDRAGAEFVSAAPEDIRALIAEVRRLRQEVSDV